MEHQLPANVHHHRRMSFWRFVEWLLVMFALVSLVGVLVYGSLLLFERILADRIYPTSACAVSQSAA